MGRAIPTARAKGVRTSVNRSQGLMSPGAIPQQKTPVALIAEDMSHTPGQPTPAGAGHGPEVGELPPTACRWHDQAVCSGRHCELPQREAKVEPAKKVKKKAAEQGSEIPDPKDPTWLEIRQRTSGHLSFLASDLISSLPDRSLCSHVVVAAVQGIPSAICGTLCLRTDRGPNLRHSPLP